MSETLSLIFGRSNEWFQTWVLLGLIEYRDSLDGEIIPGSMRSRLSKWLNGPARIVDIHDRLPPGMDSTSYSILAVGHLPFKGPEENWATQAYLPLPFCRQSQQGPENFAATVHIFSPSILFIDERCDKPAEAH
jgi:hypothetical protein